jgi:hypothetical protein
MEEDETDAAATPTKAIERARMRTARFIMVTSY